MRRPRLCPMYLWSLALFLAALLWCSKAYPQGIGGVACFAFPCQKTVASLPTPDGTQGVRVVLDGSTATDCTVGGGAEIVLCMDTGAWEAVGGSAGTDDQTAVEVLYTPTTPGDWTDPDPTEVLSGLDDLAARLTTKESETFSGDVTGPPSATVVGNDTHAHTTTTVSGLDTSDVTTGTWADARVSQSSVTQHEAAIDHDALTNFAAAEHVPAVVVNNGDYCQGGPSITLDCDVTTIPDADIDALLHRDAETKDGDLVDFDDVNGDFIAGDVDSALEELVSVNGSGPNAVDGKVEWSQLAGVPAGFADGTDDGGGDSVTVNSTAVDTTADLADSASVSWTLTDGGAGGPDTVTGAVNGIDADADGTMELSCVGSADCRAGELIVGPSTFDGNVSLSAGTTVIGRIGAGSGGFVELDSRVNDAEIQGRGARSLFIGTQSTDVLTVTDSGATFLKPRVDAPQTATCTDSGDANPGSLTIIPTTSNVELTVSDPDGCNVTVSETGALPGQMLEVTVASIAGGTANFADAAGIQEMGTGCSLPLYGTLGAKYIEAGANDRWVKRFCETDV